MNGQCAWEPEAERKKERTKEQQHKATNSSSITERHNRLYNSMLIVIIALPNCLCAPAAFPDNIIIMILKTKVYFCLTTTMMRANQAVMAVELKSTDLIFFLMQS